MAIFILLNNFMHDFSAAGWIFSSVLLWLLLRRELQADRVLAITYSEIRMLMKYSVVGIVIFGLVRALAYRQYEWSAAAGDAQVTVLIVKHILLTGVFLWGVVLYRRAGSIIKEIRK
jgi:hypothetical protein